MKQFFIFLFILTAWVASAQDQIFKKDNTKIDAKILEINPMEIKYKLFTYQDGPTIVINKSDVALVIYQNGVHEVFNAPPPPQEFPVDYRDYGRAERLQRDQQAEQRKKEKFAEVTATKQVVFLNFMEVLNGGVGVAYLREFANHYLNVYVPVSVGFVQPGVSNSLFSSSYQNVTEFKYSRKVIDVGLGLNFQTNNKRVVTHFIGPLVGINQFNGTYSSYDSGYNNYGGYYYGGSLYTPHTFVANNYYFMINNGLLVRITKNFNFMAHIAVGFQQTVFLSGDPAKYQSPNSYYNSGLNGIFYPVNAVKLGFDFGYRF